MPLPALTLYPGMPTYPGGVAYILRDTTAPFVSTSSSTTGDLLDKTTTGALLARSTTTGDFLDKTTTGDFLDRSPVVP